MKKFILLLTALTLMQLILTAQEKHFNFFVPVELHLIPSDIKSFGVSVAVYDREFHDGYPWPGSRIGSGSDGFPIINGEYMDTVIVRFDAELRKDPSKAIVWEVTLLLYGPPGYQGGVMNAMGADTPYPYDPSKPLVYHLTGNLSQSTQPIQIRNEYLKEYIKSIRK